MDLETEQIYLLNPPESQSAVTQQKLEVPVTLPVNLENVGDFSSVCRVCATITEFVIPIFSGEGLQNSLADKINKHLPIQVSDQDALPQSVCYQCCCTLLAWHELVACATQADHALRTRLHQLTPIVQEPQAAPVLPQDTEQSLETIKEDKESKPCRSYTKDDEPRIQTASDYDDPNLTDEEDDQPLSTIVSNKSTKVYDNFYKALINFKEHFVKHKIYEKYPDFTDSSDSEVQTVNEDLNESNIADYDDLTQTNMRKDRMDDETRLELNEVQNKVNGRVYYACKICGKNLSSSHTYVLHKRIHTGERPCVCHICGKQFRAPNGLQRHLTETHEKLRRHSCKWCSKLFANSQNLKQHLRIHTGERPFECPHCGKRFRQSGSLHVHLKIHTESYPHQCAECGAKFQLKSSLSRHKLKHTGERPHVCDCGKGFRQKHELNNHMLSHSDTKPFGCVICGASFRQRRALTHHTKRLHETEPGNMGHLVARGPNMLLYSAQLGQYSNM